MDRSKSYRDVIRQGLSKLDPQTRFAILTMMHVPYVVSSDVYGTGFVKSLEDDSTLLGVENGKPTMNRLLPFVRDQSDPKAIEVFGDMFDHYQTTFSETDRRVYS